MVSPEMAIVSSNSEPPKQARGVKLESLDVIDMSGLSQSELHALSLCSDSAFDARRTDDLVVPPIDRSIFNESAATHGPTYSSSAVGHRRRLADLPMDDAERAENKLIVDFLKQLLGKGESSQLVQPSPTSPQAVVSGDSEAFPQPMNVDNQVGSGEQDMQIVPYVGEIKKRGREPEPRAPEVGGDVQMQLVNEDGVPVDLEALENGDEFYASELRRRTVGLESQGDFLGFLSNLGGVWGSRRKRRKIVEASELGGALPEGWKIILGLKRRQGRVSVICRRFLSPDGEQFLSCKEVSSFFQSYVGISGASESLTQPEGDNQQVHGVGSEERAGFVHKNDDVKRESNPSSILPSPSIPIVQEKGFDSRGIDNLPEVQVQHLFECDKCNMTFNEGNSFVRHLMSFHQRITRRYNLGLSTGENLIPKECESGILQKGFQERQSLHTNVGIHTRNDNGSSGELPVQTVVQKNIQPPPHNALPSRISKMDALVEVAHNTILETTFAEFHDKAKISSSDKLKGVSTPDTGAASSGHNELKMETCKTKSTPDQSFNKHGIDCVMTDCEAMNSDQISHVEKHLSVFCTGTLEHQKHDEAEKNGDSERKTCRNRKLTPSDDVQRGTSGQIANEIANQSGAAASSTAATQPTPCFPSFTAFSDKKRVR
ncbi:uncharacterized protein LOC127802851 isoform X2 [Diospyros lotus]|uniref:uncharacterized protein LOC127802851 isoform X2 n=1 Tax=Diospyros lotus TaxID=55363 RepID=UPI00225746E0|nr:uncharacterized protein LOC127802851 isoform X2 [Diospyros lotus]